MRPQIIRYVPRHTRLPIGGAVYLRRSHLSVSFGVRDRWARCLFIPLESESHWLRHNQRRHDEFKGRVLPR